MSVGDLQHVHRVLEGDLDKWLALGWREFHREHVPSIMHEAVVHIEWPGDGEPVLPMPWGERQ